MKEDDGNGLYLITFSLIICVMQIMQIKAAGL